MMGATAIPSGSLEFAGIGNRYQVFPVVLPTRGRRFHPKLYTFATSEWLTLIVGSANLTVPGFRRNVEIVDIRRFDRGQRASLQPARQCMALLRELTVTSVKGFILPEDILSDTLRLCRRLPRIDGHALRWWRTTPRKLGRALSARREYGLSLSKVFCVNNLQREIPRRCGAAALEVHVATTF